MSKITHWIWYPLLFAIYPILFLYSRNINFVNTSQIWMAVGFTLVVLAIIFGSIYLISKDLYLSAIISTLFILVFSMAGHALNINNELHLRYPAIAPFVRVRYIAVAVVILLGLILWGAARTNIIKKLNVATPYLNLTATVLILFNVASIITFYGKAWLLNNTNVYRPDIEIVDNDAAHPDIYYIILDGYPSNSHLLQYGFDNSDFTDELEARGFYVAYDSRSNYGLTLASLPSSLNMRYITNKDVGSGDAGVNRMRQLMADNLVAQELQARGYQYIDVLSGYSVPSTIADMYIGFWSTGPEYYDKLGELPAVLQQPAWTAEDYLPLWFETTLLRYIQPARSVMETIADTNTQSQYDGAISPLTWTDPHRVLAQFDEIEKIPEFRAATFAFVHIIKPHIPVNFDRNGNIIPEAEDGDRESYFEQLHFINTRTLSMIDALLADSSVPPIIIIQADHGADPGKAQLPEETYTYFGILNAYYFPEMRHEYLTQDITPVNSFRAMFNTYFDTNYEILENRHFDLLRGYDNIKYMEEIDIDEWLTEQQ